MAVVGPGAKCTQITDEAGHRFYNPDGTANKNPKTRIPNAAPVDPLVAAMPTRGVALKPPAGAPILFVFGKARGKSLSFELGGKGEKRLGFYMPGTAFDVRFSGSGGWRCAGSPSRASGGCRCRVPVR